ncbi:MAG: HAD hydrolase-like protein [Burkholderiaceae bacterium]
MNYPILDGDASHACLRYEAIRKRLGPAQFAQHSESARDLSALREHFDVFVLDGYGVLNIGQAAIPGAVNRVAELKASGALVLVLTNGASLPHDQVIDKYLKLGFRFDDDEIISSRDALVAYLDDAAVMRQWGVMAPDYAAIDGLSGNTQFPVPLELGDDPALYDAVQGFILLSSSGWTQSRQDLLLNSFRRNPRPLLVGNPDLVAPLGEQFSLEPGWYAHELADHTGCIPHFFGKPFDDVFEMVSRRIAKQQTVPPNRIAMVGDTLHTDILGGARAGWKSVLITGHGLLRGLDVDQIIQRSGIRPDYICPDP